MKILRLRVKHADDWQNCLRDGVVAEGKFFVPTTEPCAGAEDVVVEVASPGLPNKVLIRGVVEMWRPALPRLRVRAGAMVRFAEGEAHKLVFVTDALSGKHPEIPRRRHDRFPIQINVKYRVGQSTDSHTCALSEISAGGGMLGTSEPLPMGAHVLLEVVPPGSVAPMTIQSRVNYQVPNGCTGLKFLYRDSDGSRRLREMVRRLIAS